MALIKCVECGKEISDKAESCINCGCPINISLNKNLNEKKKVLNKYKKFNFDYMKELENDPKLKKHYQKFKRMESKFFAIVAIIAYVLSFWLTSVSKSNPGVGLLMIISFIIAIFSTIVSIKSFFSKSTKVNLKNEIKEIYYKKMIKTFSSIPQDLDYDEISLIEATSKNELLDEAYYLNADALINVQVQKYTTSDTKSKFNGIGAQRRIDTKVTKHENWTAGAVKVNTDIYYEPLNVDKLQLY